LSKFDNKEIAKKLGIGHGTVRNYTTSIYEKLEVKSRAQAVAFAYQHGIV
jgi:DNA-binding NarL/FixJ family response regulator